MKSKAWICNSHRNWKIFFVFTGVVSTIWFLIRVIPKPSRAQYPCMRAAAPWASAFVVYILSLTSGVYSLKKVKHYLSQRHYSMGILFSLLFLITFISSLVFDSDEILASLSQNQKSGKVIEEKPNDPIGQGVGIFPGRVVWVHEPDATNENCDPHDFGNTWYHNQNNSQHVIDSMLTLSLRHLTGASNKKEAWDSIFVFHNNTRNKGRVNYENGEKVFIKTNATSTWSANINPADLSDVDNNNYGIAETSPQLVLAVLSQLVNIVGVAQEDIYVGDPMKHIYKEIFEIWHVEFPNVNYIDHDDYPNRKQVKNTGKAAIFYSDRGEIMRTGTWSDATVGDPVKMDYLYDIFDEMEYMLNIPTLKAHRRAGITMFPKNHFGSHTRKGAKHLHGGLVAPEGEDAWRSGYGLYRVQVDIMGHDLLGKKNLVYIMDALYTSEHEVTQPTRWHMSPFNGDWMSSVFASFDPVAIESVGYDFLKAEYSGVHGRDDCVQMYGVDDYLHQAADPANWPANIVYDPENDGTPIERLGVHEHWNNKEDKKYSRNLGADVGIELISVNGISTSIPKVKTEGINFSVFPNPVVSDLNIEYKDLYIGPIIVVIYDMNGREVFFQHYSKTEKEFNRVIPVDQYQKGTYVVSLETERTRNSQSIIFR